MTGWTSGLLLSAAAGYWVLERAENHKRGLRRVGRWLGGAIILVALIGVACRVASYATGECPGRGSSRYFKVLPSSAIPSTLP